jgi:hypothetical protein
LFSPARFLNGLKIADHGKRLIVEQDFRGHVTSDRLNASREFNSRGWIGEDTASRRRAKVAAIAHIGDGPQE